MNTKSYSTSSGVSPLPGLQAELPAPSVWIYAFSFPTSSGVGTKVLCRNFVLMCKSWIYPNLIHMVSLQRVVEIYFIKQQLLEDQDFKKSMRGMSKPVSKVYGVSARTIRDIWNQKSWARATKLCSMQSPTSSAEKARCTSDTNVLQWSLTLLVFRILEKLAVQRALATANLALLGWIGGGKTYFSQKGSALQRRKSHQLASRDLWLLETIHLIWILSAKTTILCFACPQSTMVNILLQRLQPTKWIGWRKMFWQTSPQTHFMKIGHIGRD